MKVIEESVWIELEILLGLDDYFRFFKASPDFNLRRDPTH